MVFCHLCSADFSSLDALRDHLLHHNLGVGDPAPLLASLDAPANDLQDLLTELRTEA